MLSTAIAAGVFLSKSHELLASYTNNSSQQERVIQEVTKPNLDSLKQVIADNTFIWNDTTYRKYKDLIADTTFGGYSVENKKYNKFHVLQKSGKDIASEIDSLGTKKFASLLDQKVGRGGSLNNLFENVQAYNTLYKEAAQKNGIERRLLLAVGFNESHFLPYAISHANCLGLNQLHPTVYQESNPFDVEENVDIAASLLKNHLQYYDGNDTLALTAYNRGRAGLNRVMSKAKEKGITDAEGIINFKENNNYLLSKEAREYAKKTLMYKELIRQYQPHEGEQKFLSRLASLRENLKNLSNP